MGKQRSAGRTRPTSVPPKLPRLGWQGRENGYPPNYGKPQASAQERRLTYNGANGFEPLIFGEVHDVGGAIVKWQGLSGGRVLVRYLISVGPIESITNIRIGGIPIGDRLPLIANNFPTGSNISQGYQVYLGEPNQPVSAIMWNSNDLGTTWVNTRYPGRAYIAAIFPPLTEDQGTLDITDLKCDVRGIRVRDFATDPTLVNRYFREDPALIIADLKTSKRYGGRIPDSKINWSLIATETSPYVMQDLGAGIKRYPIGFVINSQQQLNDLIANLCDHAQLYIPYNSGKFNILADKPRAHTGITINDTHITATPGIHSKGTTSVFDSIEINYTDSENGWDQKSTPIELPNIHNSNEPLDSESFSLLGTRQLQQAKRIGTYHLNKSQLDIQFTVAVNEIGAYLLPGDRIYLTSSDLNLTNADVYCVDVILNTDGYTLILEEYDADIYSDVIQTEVGFTRPTNPGPNDTPNPPSNLVLTEVIAGQDSRIKIAFTPAPVAYTGQFTRIMARRTVGAVVGEWFKVNDTTGNVDFLLNANPGEFYEFKLKTVTQPPFNKESTELTGSITATGVDLTGPTGPAGANAKTLIVISDRQNITYDETGAVNPSVQLTTFTTNKQNTTAVVNWSATRADGTAITPVTNLLSAATGDSVTMSAANFNTQRGSTEGVIVTASLTDGATITDKISVVKVQKGATGNQGPANFTLISQGLGVVIYSPNSIGRTDNTSWAGGAYSAEGYIRGAFVSFKAARTDINFMAGLNSDPTTDSSFSSIDYGWYFNTGALKIYENGSEIGSYGTYTVDTILSIVYDGANIRYYKDGALQRTISRAVGSALYFDSSMQAAANTAQIKDIQFGPMGETSLETALIPIGTANTMSMFSPNSIGKIGGGTAWNAGFYSPSKYVKNLSVSWKPANAPAADMHCWVGFSDNASPSADINNADFALGMNAPVFSGVLQILENGSSPGTYGAYTSSTVLTMTYDGEFVRYFKDGVLIRSVSRPIGAPLYVVTGFYYARSAVQITDLVIGALGETGLPASSVLAQVDSMAAIGGRLLVGSKATTKLTSDLTALATTIFVESNVLSNGDRIVLQKVVAGVQQTEFMAVTSVAGGTGPYSHTVTRDLDASGANTWSANDPVVSTGQTGSSFIDLYSARGLKAVTEVGPAVVGNVRNSATWNDWTPRWAIGNLNGLYGYASDIYGAAFGIPTGAWLKIDPTNGIRIGHNATTKIQIDAAGNASFTGAVTATSGSFTGSITASSGTIGGWTIGASKLSGAAIEFDSQSVGYITIGSPRTYNTAGTKFYVDGNGYFSLGTALTWDGANITITAGNVVLNSGGITFPAASGIYWANSSMYLSSDTNTLLINTSAGLGFKFNNIVTVTNAIDATGANGYINCSQAFQVTGVNVVGPRGAAVADAGATLASVQAQLNLLLARVRAHGLIAT